MTIESRHTEIEGYDVNYWEGGSGFPVLMMHGVGPGTSIMAISNPPWRRSPNATTCSPQT